MMKDREKDAEQNWAAQVRFSIQESRLQEQELRYFATAGAVPWPGSSLNDSLIIMLDRIDAGQN